MLKPPIIVAIAFALVGCESTVTDGEAGGGPSTCEGCQPTECPEYAPQAEEPCSPLGIECEYEEIHGDECDEFAVEVSFVCKASGWVKLASYCSEYEPECPSQLPIAGTPCDWEDDDAGTCEYDLESSCDPVGWAAADCDLDAGVWQVSLPNGTCVYCDYMTGAECAAASDCRWLEPPCDSLQPFEPYCAPAIDCAVGGCSDQDICVDHVVNDCWASELEPVCCEGIAGVCQALPPSED